MKYPRIIQGGMGVAVSAWPLARAVSMRGQLGVISGTGIDTVLVRRLQMGDPDGKVRLALDHFPIKELAAKILEKYFVAGGKADSASFKAKPILSAPLQRAVEELIVVGNFVEVWLAKHGHTGLVGINLLEKIQIPNLASLYGAMLAGVDVVLMGAGIPRAIPKVLDGLSNGEKVEMKLEVTGGEATATFDPADYLPAPLKRPMFLAIVASASLGQMLAKKCTPPVDGFVIEGFTAGGHNAPPRGQYEISAIGEPVYGERDIPELEKFRDLGLPFWLAGSYGTHEGLQEALAEGAQGVQVGTAFAFCDESGITRDIKTEVIQRSIDGTSSVLTSAKASPTGFPFKVVSHSGSMSNIDVVEERKRICDLGYLRENYIDEKGKLAYRCPSEPVEDYVRKGGDIENTVGRLCVCNGLLATIGLGQVRKGIHEPILVTAGDDIANVKRYLPDGMMTYSASDVIDIILGERESEDTQVMVSLEAESQEVGIGS